MALNRRHFLLFLGISVGTAACPGWQRGASRSPVGEKIVAELGFQPLQAPLPLPSYGLSTAQQIADFSDYEVVDDLVLPEGFTYDVIASWGDKLGDSRCGYNNDYLSLIETERDQGWLTVNFEYISAIPWMQTYERVIGKSLPLAEVKQAVESAIKAAKSDQVDGLNAYALPDNAPLKQNIKLICQEALIDQGIGVMAIRRQSNGQWQRSLSNRDRRITGISGLFDGRYLKASGPAVAVFQKPQGLGYRDRLGDKIIGTFQNCAGGTTPWGTVLSAEENIQTQVPEAVYPDGTSFHPSARPFRQTDEELIGLGNVFGLAGNKYGWMVEVDPANPQDYGTKHTWLGRYRHEAVGIRAEAGKPLVVYSGCDRRGGHLYKFVSQGKIVDPQDRANSRLFEQGRLYAAQLAPDGTGRWIPLAADTPVDPVSPAMLAGVMLPLPQRPQGGAFKATDPEEIAVFKQQFKTLGDLYMGNESEQQGAILIDAHLAANAAGATCTARPEDTEIAPDGTLFVAFTSGGISKTDGSPDVRIFKGPDGNTAYEYGWVMRLQENNNDPAALSFQWQMIATGGEPAIGGMGFSNPDNLVFDAKGNLWVVTDMSSDKMNQAVPAGRVAKNGVPLAASELRGVFGNNAIWCMPPQGAAAGQVHLFGIGPMDCETTGPCFTTDHKTLFLSVQHPGEIHGMRQAMASATRQMALRTTDGQEFIQTRRVPIGSNWPSREANQPPKPAIVAIRRQNNGEITA
ncbi:PhoX family protein [Pantanalinema sp. GBBB05]|uniref:PhoX family protein n=1 Tax=Pantanalinema sp. GBBB05 TaxID=2604139 RepID=UPI001D7CC494|nr:DUF839 domain-containing protein [Pantanalinema sp. GBBB05]